MSWLILAAIIAGLFMFASASRKSKQRAAVAGLRAEFPPIARMRLVAACPGLEPLLGDGELRLLFDWMLIEMFRRTRTSGLGELMRWSIEHGEGRTLQLSAEIARDAVDRLSPPVLAVIDDCHGRTFASVIVDQALTEAGQRISPGLERKYV